MTSVATGWGARSPMPYLVARCDEAMRGLRNRPSRRIHGIGDPFDEMRGRAVLAVDAMRESASIQVHLWIGRTVAGYGQRAVVRSEARTGREWMVDHRLPMRRRDAGCPRQEQLGDDVGSRRHWDANERSIRRGDFARRPTTIAAIACA